MKKKIKLQLNPDLYSKTYISLFVTGIILCIIAMTFGLIMFSKSYFASLSKVDKAEVATVKSKVKTCSRRFEERTVWDYLDKNTLIYNGDTIKTKNASQLCLLFNDGTELILTENTMTQIFVGKDKKLTVNLSSGLIILNNEVSNSNITVNIADKKVVVNGKAIIKKTDTSNEKSDKIAEVILTEGEAYTQTMDNKIIIKEHESKDLQYIKQITDNIEEKTLNNIISADVKLQPLEDEVKSFFIKQEKSLIKSQSTDKDAVNKELNKVNLKAPASGKVFNDAYFLTNPNIIFRWNSVSEATNYRLTITDKKGKLIFDRTLGNKTEYTFTNLELLSKGSFTWSVTPVKKNKKGEVIKSAKPTSSSFKIDIQDISGETTSGSTLYGN